MPNRSRFATHLEYGHLLEDAIGGLFSFRHRLLTREVRPRDGLRGRAARGFALAPQPRQVPLIGGRHMDLETAPAFAGLHYRQTLVDQPVDPLDGLAVCVRILPNRHKLGEDAVNF